MSKPVHVAFHPQNSPPRVTKEGVTRLLWSEMLEMALLLCVQDGSGLNLDQIEKLLALRGKAETLKQGLVAYSQLLKVPEAKLEVVS